MADNTLAELTAARDTIARLELQNKGLDTRVKDLEERNRELSDVVLRAPGAHTLLLPDRSSWPKLLPHDHPASPGRVDITPKQMSTVVKMKSVTIKKILYILRWLSWTSFTAKYLVKADSSHCYEPRLKRSWPRRRL